MITLLPLNQFPAHNLGQWAECPLPVNGADSFHNILLRVAGQGYGTTGAPLDIQHAIESIEIAPDTGAVLTVSPRALRLMEVLTNANGDVADPSVLNIPLARLGLTGVSDWPTGKMGKCLLRVLPKAALPANSSGNSALTLTALTAHARSEQLAAPAPLGGVFSFHMSSHLPVTGWNIIESVSLGHLRALTKLLLFCPLSGASLNNTASNAITATKLTRGREVVYDATKQMALAELASSPLYRAQHIGGAENEFFAAVFDTTGRPGDFLGLVNGNVRQPLKLEYYWNPAVTPETVQIVAEGILAASADPLVSAI